MGRGFLSDFKEFNKSLIVPDTLPRFFRVGLFFTSSNKTLSDELELVLCLSIEPIIDFKSLNEDKDSSCFGEADLSASPSALLVFGSKIPSCLERLEVFIIDQTF